MATPTLVVIFQRGAMDGLNVLIPYADGRYYDLRPNIAIAAPGAAGGALDLDGYFGLHPALAPLKALYDAGDLTAIHATGGINFDRSHFSAQARMEIASDGPDGTGGGWLGRHLVATAPTGARGIRGISIGTALARSLSGSPDVAAISSSEAFRIHAREPALWQSALPVLHGGIGSPYEAESARVLDILAAFAATPPHTIEPAADASYPVGRFGEQLRQAAQYIKADLGIEAITIDIDGWDQHANENRTLDPLLQKFAAGLAAFRTDLGARFDDVIVVTMSEFGRRAAENATLGTDHGRGSAMFVLGGRINGARVVADWPGLDAAGLDNGDLRVTLDYRNILGELLSGAFGNPQFDRVFPGCAASPPLGLLR